MAKSDDDFVKQDLKLLHDTANNVHARRQPVCLIDEVRLMIELDRLLRQADDFVKQDLKLLHDTANNVHAGRQPVCRIDEVRLMIELDRPIRQAMAALADEAPPAAAGQSVRRGVNADLRAGVASLPDAVRPLKVRDRGNKVVQLVPGRDRY